MFDLELSPAARRTGVAYLHDVDLDARQTLSPGDVVEIRDEGGVVHSAVVERLEPARIGTSYRLRVTP